MQQNNNLQTILRKLSENEVQCITDMMMRQLPHTIPPIGGTFNFRYALEPYSYQKVISMTSDQFAKEYTGFETEKMALNANSETVNKILMIRIQQLEDVQLGAAPLLQKNIKAFEKKMNDSPDSAFFKQLYEATYDKNDPTHVIYLGSISTDFVGGFSNTTNIITVMQGFYIGSSTAEYEDSTVIHEFIHKFDKEYNNGEHIKERYQMLEKFLQKYPTQLHQDILLVLAEDFAALSQGMINKYYVKRVNGTKESFVSQIMSEIPTRLYDRARDVNGVYKKESNKFMQDATLPSSESILFF